MAQTATKKVTAKKEKPAVQVAQAAQEISQANNPRNETVTHLQRQVASTTTTFRPRLANPGSKRGLRS